MATGMPAAAPSGLMQWLQQQQQQDYYNQYLQWYQTYVLPYWQQQQAAMQQYGQGLAAARQAGDPSLAQPMPQMAPPAFPNAPAAPPAPPMAPQPMASYQPVQAPTSGTYSFAPPSQSQAQPSGGGVSFMAPPQPQGAIGTPISVSQPGSHTGSGWNPVNGYGSTVSNADAFQQAYSDLKNTPNNGFAWGAYINSPQAQDELYLKSGDASQSFSNWFRRNAGDFYNRYVADSAAQNNPSMQYSDWLASAHLGNEYLNQTPESRGYFQGVSSPAARWIIQ